ncbi:MAG: hypothetical protein PUJ82_11900 [Spirochaetales bacterium]|nr:hypothetical protein [Spirochaetales bacterium]
MMAETRNVDSMDTITVSAKVLGEICGIGDRQIRNLAEEGIMCKNSHGKYLLLKSVKNYIITLKVAKAGQNVESDLDQELDLDTEKAKHEHVKLQIAEIKLAMIQGKAHKSEDVERVITDMFEKFRSKLQAMPAKLAKKLEGKDRIDIQNILQSDINSALEELAAYNPAIYYSDEYIDIGEDEIFSLGKDAFDEG